MKCYSYRKVQRTPKLLTMDVTLERVQFKFASIIGELCSKPDVLSQFAVWVDLKLAEYKLKGSISLDCTGEIPAPIWVKGTFAAFLAKSQASETATISPSQMLGSGDVPMEPVPRQNLVKLRTPVVRISRSQPSRKSVQQALTLPPKIAVKGEALQQSPYPDRFTEHAYSSESTSRKRQAAETVSSEPLKKELCETTPSSSVDQSITYADFHYDSHQEMEPAMPVVDTGSGLLRITPQVTVTGPVSADLSPSPGSPSLGCGDQVSGDGGQTSIDVAAIRQRKALYKLRSYVTKFDRWVKAEYNESRPMEDIPPEYLDPYLADFFMTLKTDRGGEYGYDSLITLRSGLEQYLQKQGYPHLIRSSPLFCNSQGAVRKRRLKQTQERQKRFQISYNHHEH